MPRTRRRRWLLSAVVAVAAAVWLAARWLGDGGEATAPSPVAACLDPRQPQDPTGGSWVPARGPIPVALYAGQPVTDVSDRALRLADRFVSAVERGFSVDEVTELSTASCVTSRSVRLGGADGGHAYLEVHQLRRPVARHTFSVGDEGRPRRHLDDGSELVLADFDGDGSRVSAIVVRPDGLLVRVTVASANSPVVAGWPTTIVPPPSTAPHTPAALSLEEVAAVARRLVSTLG